MSFWTDYKKGNQACDELYAVCESIPVSVVSTLRNSALHNPLVSGLWSGESEVRWVRCANQATVCLEYKLTEHFFPSVNNTPSSPLLLETGRTRGKDGRAPHFLRKRVTLLFTPSLPANSSDCFVFPFCFSGGVKWSALKHQHGATVCALSAPSGMCAEISVSCRISAPQNLLETEHKCLSVTQNRSCVYRNAADVHALKRRLHLLVFEYSEPTTILQNI